MSNDLYSIIKEIVRDEIGVSNPVIFSTGIVESINPLRIRIDQKTLLLPSMIRLTNCVKDYSVEIAVQGVSDSGGDTYAGTTTVTVKSALKVGESVLLLREQGGQKYTVIDRM